MTTICFINQTNFDLIRNFLLDTEGIPDDLKQIAKKMRKSCNLLKREYKQKAKDHFQGLIREREALTASIPPPPPPPMATPVAEPIEQQITDRLRSATYPPPTPPQPVIYDSDESSDTDGEGLDSMEDDDSDDEPIANLLNDPDLHSYNICSARCASGTREEVGRCTNPTTSFETNHLGQRVGVCRLHKRAIDTAMAKYFQWDRSMGHLYGWWNSPETIRERNASAVLKAGYQGARRQPKRRKTRRFRGQIKGNGSVYSGVMVGYR